MKKLLPAFLLGVLLQSCTTASLLYLRNPTGASIPVTVGYNSLIDSGFFDSGLFTLRMAEDTLVPISSKTYRQLNDTILFEQLDTSQIRFVMPPHSTIQVSNPAFINYIEMPQRSRDGLVRTHRLSNFDTLQVGKKPLIGAVPYYYDIKD